MRTFVISSVDGSVLHRGRSRSLKSLVEALVAEGVSMAGADLSGLNLSHLDLEGGDFAGACVDGADLRGAVVRSASFRKASLRGVNAAGLMAERADFTDADLSPAEGKPSCFSGGTFSYARMDGVLAERTDFSGSFMSSSTFVGAKALKASFSNSIMHNVDWADAEVIGCDLSDTVMRSTWTRAGRHMPERTAGAIVIGNDTTRAEIGPDNREFSVDAFVGKALRGATWALLTGGAVTLGSVLPIEEGFMLDSPLSKGLGFVALTTAAVLAKEKIGDLFKEHAIGWLEEAALRTRVAINRVAHGGKSLANIAVALLSARSADIVARALGPKDAGLWARLKATASGEIEVIVCDRKSLAKALARLTDAVGGRVLDKTNVVILRRGSGSESYPQAVTLRSDGSAETHWKRPDGTMATAVWPLEEATPEGRNRMLQRFIDCVLIELGTTALGFDPSTHAVRQGRDGSAVVVRRSDGRLRNPDGPVILTPDDETIELAP